MRKILFITQVMMLSVLLVSCGADQAMKKGDKFYAVGEYYDAAAQYRKAYSGTPTKEKAKRGQISVKLADCYRRINGTTKAITAYKNVIRYHQDDSLTHLRLAQQLMKNGNYKEAAKQFQTAIDSLQHREGGEWKENVLKLAGNGLKAAQQAPQWKKEGSAYTVKRMDLFNSRRDDYSPALAGEDNNQLFFTSTRNQAQGDEYNGITGAKSADIFFSQKDDKGKWGKPQTIDSELNSVLDEGACCFSPDGKTMYLTQCKTDPNYPRFATIAVSNRSDASWSKPTELKISKDTLSSFAHPAVSPDGEWLYFVSNMPGGKGGYDIWRTRLSSTGLTLGVENVGEPINTPGDEMFPTFRPNGDLYFSSDGHPGMGGLDIFIATIGSDHRYHVEHPGYPLNSMGDDFGMTFEGPHNRGFFSSSRGDGRGNDHIFSFENPEFVQLIRGWVYEVDGYELHEAQVRIVGSDGTNQRVGVKSDGSFEYVTTPGTEYIIQASCQGFLNHKEELTADNSTELYTLQFPLANISVPVLVDNIFFEFDKARLLSSSTIALDSLVMLLNENPNITIELSAHTDYRGSDEYNKTLSQRRAESVVSYLISKGIAADRLTPVGYGEENPKRIRRKVADRYKWLNEGDVLTEEFIGKLKPAEQETANALNRRTEFRVLKTTYNMFDSKGNLTNPPKPRKPQTTEESYEFIFFE